MRAKRYSAQDNHTETEEMIQPGGGLALLPATCESLVLADWAFICANKVRALPGYAVMIEL